MFISGFLCQDCHWVSDGFQIDLFELPFTLNKRQHMQACGACWGHCFECGKPVLPGTIAKDMEHMSELCPARILHIYLAIEINTVVDVNKGSLWTEVCFISRLTEHLSLYCPPCGSSLRTVGLKPKGLATGPMDFVCPFVRFSFLVTKRCSYLSL